MFDYSPSLINGEADGAIVAGQDFPEGEPLLDAYSQTIVDVVDTVGPAVVRVETQADPIRRTQGGMGSGVIISPDGLVLTNSHVVHGERTLRLALPDARTMEARIVGDDPDTDLALLRVVDNATLPMARLGNSKGAETRPARYRNRQSPGLRIDGHGGRRLGARALAARPQRQADR